MKVIFRSRDFASVESAGYGFNHRRPMSSPWHYQGRVQHRNWQGTYECFWDNASDTGKNAVELLWTVRGDARLFGLAAALKSQGFSVDVEQE
ncbi:hypothetical protein EPA93_44685 [Ktedonosporobacter rubrisoli]|uniref:Uncharacterized protein n=1 Tax=Ktedonosporobacter rubrisoli TaxID=2509675 RepID=A0A4P6K402_KTERU|nr:hypothetical protein [Ktedonosporobacter rubrisoli]QBD82692.1 hypothetical protein EPA93_44685 [Ktedonosporobacter rubrisoli]